MNQRILKFWVRWFCIFSNFNTFALKKLNHVKSPTKETAENFGKG